MNSPIKSLQDALNMMAKYDENLAESLVKIQDLLNAMAKYEKATIENVYATGRLHQTMNKQITHEQFYQENFNL